MPLKIFLSYAHEDEKLKKELEKHLSLVNSRRFLLMGSPSRTDLTAMKLSKRWRKAFARLSKTKDHLKNQKCNLKKKLFLHHFQFQVLVTIPKSGFRKIKNAIFSG